MTTETKQETWQYTGNVVSVNEKGLKLDSYGDDWLNYTKEEWRGNWYDPQRGENITVQCQSDKNGKMWIKSIVLNGNQDWSEPAAPPKPQYRDTSIERQVAVKAATEVIVALINQGHYGDQPDFATMDQIKVELPNLALELLDRVLSGE